MPYKVIVSSKCPDNKPYATVKVSDGRVMGCHETAKKAHAQIEAIEANEKKKRGVSP